MSASGVILRGRHVTLRPLQVSDAALTLTWRQGGRTTFLNKGAQTVAEQTAWIEARPLPERNFVIELRSGAPVGMLSLIGIDYGRTGAPSRRDFSSGSPSS